LDEAFERLIILRTETINILNEISGWSLVRDKTRARVNLRKSSKRDVEVAIILQQFDEIVTGWRIILRRSKEKAHYANMLLGAREHFVRQLAIIGSHSKVSEKRTSKVAQQSFHTRYLEQVVRRLERIEESRKRILNLEMSTLKARRAYEISEVKSKSTTKLKLSEPF